MNFPDDSGCVLLVDDDPVLRMMAGETLRQAGFEVREAADGPEALARFAERPYDLVLLDVMMPVLDGFQVCARIRAQGEGAWVPVLMMTGLDDSESIGRAYQSGATDFITKPINWALLPHRVRYCMRANRAIEGVKRSRESLARAQRQANMGSWEWSMADGRITCSDELKRMLDSVAFNDEWTTSEAFSLAVASHDRERVRAVRSAARANGDSYQLTFNVVRRDGAVRSLFEQAIAVKDAAGRVVRLEGITQDVTERVEAERRIKHLVFHDAMTGLPNRLFLSEMAVSALERARRLNAPCAVLHADLDRFKAVNDAYGDPAGDEVLLTIANRVATCVRVADLTSVSRTGPSSQMVARIGGDAFTILLLDIRGPDDAMVVAERLLEAISTPVQVAGKEVVLTASIGIALFPRDGDGIDLLARHAEQAMYVAKSAGRGGVRFFDDRMNQAASSKLETEADLRRALVSGELRLHFQPQIDVAAGRVMGAEALIRWQHPERGLVSPAEFIPLAEESGLIVSIGEWVVRTACAQMNRWANAGLPRVPVSVNLSGMSFMQATLVEDLDRIVRASGIGADQLTLEVTESLLMQDLEHTIGRLRDLRGRGFGLSLDDFGTGYSSLAYLKRFPVDELKIDRSFVQDAVKGGLDEALVAAVIGLGRLFGLRVVAEGVETEAHAEFLLRHGCRLQQGYLFARPMPAEAFAAFLANPVMPKGLASPLPEV